MSPSLTPVSLRYGRKSHLDQELATAQEEIGMQLEPLALTVDLLDAFARSAQRFAARLAPDDQARWRQIVMRAATVAPEAGGQAGATASGVPDPRDIDWTAVWQLPTLIAPLLPERALVRSFRDQPTAGLTAGAANGMAFAGRLAMWCESLDPPQQAMVADLLVRAGGDDEDEAVSPLLEATGRAFSGDLFAPVEFFDYQNVVRTLQDHPVADIQPDGLRSHSESDPIALLVVHHRATEARFAVLTAMLVSCSPDATRGAGAAPDTVQSLLTTLEEDLEAHIHVEEEVLFPRLREAAAPWDGNLINQMIAGHDQIRRKWKEVEAAFATKNRDTASGIERPSVEQTVAALQHMVHTHFQNEEDLVFRLAPELLSPDTLAAIGRELTATTSITEDADMAESHNPTPPLRGETTGTSERPSRRVAAPVLAFDLLAEIDQLHQETGWIGGERDGKTLVKEPDFRIVLTAMKSGTRMAQHEAAARVSIQVLIGKLVVSIYDQTTELTEGNLLVLDRDISHDVVALVDSAFLLTLAWPERAEDASPSSSSPDPA